KQLSTRFFASASQPPPADFPILTPKSVGIWLLSSSFLVLAIVVVGGVTRLTESGLSITEWKPVAGVIPPLSRNDWEDEFTKYKATPEFKMLNHSMNLDEFKRIYYMEWGHRVLGRMLGVVFVVPLVYFVATRKVSRSLGYKLGGLAALIGAQGVMGWYMVKSGLEDSIIEKNAVPRVSHYRLAAHLFLAFLLYAGMFWNGLGIIRDWKFAHGAAWSKLPVGESISNCLKRPLTRRFARQAGGVAAVVFITAMSGALVAGLDAGLLYNEWPKMGGRWVPPKEDMFTPFYAQKADKSDLWWRNILENPTTVQFDHRTLALATYLATGQLAWLASRPAYRAALPPAARTAALIAFGMANVQLTLGVLTLLLMVPVDMAATHQAGSLFLLSAAMHVMLVFRKPGHAAKLWRQALAKQTK
ncbi:cytochrome oxidase assembly, partial [Fistulina hepatica ATCC 64428]